MWETPYFSNVYSLCLICQNMEIVCLHGSSTCKDKICKYHITALVPIVHIMYIGMEKT